jgi:hypothetical protein
MTGRAICISRDAGTRQLVGEALAGSGVAVVHHEQLPAQIDRTDGITFVIVDRATRERLADALRGARAPVVVIGDDLADDALMTLMVEAPVSHLVADPSSRELGITSEKLVSGDLFGLEKYLGADADIGRRVLHDDAGKRAAIAEVCAWAEGVGARRPIVHRLASVIDELLMNALIDAPRESSPVLSSNGAVVRWGRDATHLAVSVSDSFGTLRQRDVIDHVRRARGEHGRPNVDAPGAGLGLYLVLGNVASLIVNVDPGRCTEVICLFDLIRDSRRAIPSSVRSFHVFSS